MADFRPFRALRYDARRVGALQAVIAPSTDALDAQEYREAMATSPWHYGHLDPCRHGIGETLESSAYTAAAERLRTWIQDGVLRHDEAPGFYLVEERFLLDGVVRKRISVTGALRLHDHAEGVVLRHERTLDGPKQDRLMLRRASLAQLSPIFLLFRDTKAVLARVHSALTERPPTAEVETQDDVSHRLWAVSAPEHVLALRDMASAGPLLIADGHHRYETALAHRDEQRRAAPGTDDLPTDFQLATLCAMDDPGLVLLPFHRLIHFPTTEAQGAFVDALQRHGAERISGSHADAWQARLEAAHQEGPALGFVAQEGQTARAWLVRPPRGETPWSGAPIALRWLHDTLLPHAADLDLDTQARGDRLRYTPDLLEVERWQASEANLSVAVLVPTLAVEAIADACRDGEPLPQKSTYFAPKPAPGLVMLDLTLETSP